MRIAFFVHFFPQVSEGFIVTQAAQLIARGHEVDVFAMWGIPPHAPADHPLAHSSGLLAGARTPQFPLPIGPRLLAAPGMALRRPALPWRVLARVCNPLRFGRRALNLRLLYEAAMFRGLPRYDVVHCHFADLAPPLLQLRATGAFAAPVVVHVRGVDITRRPRELGERSYRRAFAEADAVLANCERFRELSLDLGCPPDRIEVLRSGIDLARFAFVERPARPGRTLRLAAVGRLVEKKGFEYLVRALPAALAAGVDLRCSVLGDGPLRAPLEQLAGSLGVSDRIEWLGAGGTPAVIELLTRSDLLVAPSVSAADGDQDAPVNTLKEAMATGLPVVATRHGGIPELVEHGVSGLLVPERDAAALAAAIVQLAQDRARWPRMARAGREKVAREYDIDRITDQLVALYQRLAPDAAGGAARPVAGRPQPVHRTPA